MSFAGLCSSDAHGIANITSAVQDSARLIVSFLNGTDEWKNIGAAAESDPFLSVNGGLVVSARNANDSELALTTVTGAPPGFTKQLARNHVHPLSACDMIPPPRQGS